ncbi:MAG: hypothetical protein WC982_03810 [Advenella sp.]
MKILGNMVKPEVVTLIYDCYKSGLRLENINGKLFFKGSREAVINKITLLTDQKDQILELLTDRSTEDKLYRLVQFEVIDVAELADIYLVWACSPFEAQKLVENSLEALSIM